MQNMHEISANSGGRGPELLTASHVGERLGVDTSTIYRMAADGRLPAVKVGRQWRFPRAELERVLSVGLDMPTEDARDAVVAAPASNPAVLPVPAEFAETVTSLVAEALGVMMVITDMDGQPLTEVANPCQWFEDHAGDPAVLDACTAEWRGLANDLTFTPEFRMGPQGFRCARAFIRRGNELLGMVLAGGLAARSAATASDSEDGLYHLDAAAEARVLHVLPQVAAAVSKVAGHGAGSGDHSVATDLSAALGAAASAAN